MSQKNLTVIPAKQLQISGTFSELNAKLLNREVGWCTDDSQLYYKDNGELVPASYGEFTKFNSFNIAKEYNPDNIYKKNSFVTHEGKIYVAVDSNVTGPWDESKWEQIPLGDYISKISSDMASNNDFVYIDPWKGDDANIGITPDTPVKTLAGAWAVSQEKYPYRTDQLNITLVSDGEYVYIDGLDVSAIPVSRLIIHGDVPNSNLFIYGENSNLSIYSDANISYFNAYSAHSANAQGLSVQTLVVSNVRHFVASDNGSALYAGALIVHVNKYGFTSENYMSVGDFYCDAPYVSMHGRADIGNDSFINSRSYVTMSMDYFNCLSSLAITSGAYVALNSDGKFNVTSGLTIRSADYAYISATDLTTRSLQIDALSYVSIDCDTISDFEYGNGVCIKSGKYVSISGTSVTVDSFYVDALDAIYIDTDMSVTNDVVLNSGDYISTKNINCYMLNVSTGAMNLNGNATCTECYVDAKENVSSNDNTIISANTCISMTSGGDISLSVVESSEVYLSCEDYLSIDEIHPSKYSGSQVSLASTDMSVSSITTHPDTDEYFINIQLTAKDYASIPCIKSEGNVYVSANSANIELQCVCDYLYVDAVTYFTLGGDINISYSTQINCRYYNGNGGSHNYGSYYYLHTMTGAYMGSSPYYADDFTIINDSGSLQGPPYIYANTLYVKSYNAELYGITPKTGVTEALTCTFDIEDRISFGQANIVFGFGTVNINAHEIELKDGYTYCRYLNINCTQLILNNSIYVESFSIDVANMLLQGNPGTRIYLPLRYTYGTGDSDYISYDNQSRSYLKAGALYCPTQYSEPSYGLLHPSYGSNSRDIDIQIDMLLSPAYPGGGPMSPMVLGQCLSGGSTFNSTISGHVGGYVAYSGTNSNFKVSEWGHDILYIDSSFGGIIQDPIPGSSNNKTGKITLKYDDVMETNHFWFDPNQGDDVFDGFTRQTPVKTAKALLHAIMKKAGGSYNSDTHTFTITDPVTIHILSTGVNSCREAKYAYGFSYVDDIYQIFGGEQGLGIDFRLSNNSHVQFNMLEFVPEAPDMSLYVASFGANVLIAKGFYCIGFFGYESSGISYLESSGSIIINNSSSGYNSNHTYYSNPVGPIYMQSRNIGLKGIFNCLTAKASGEIYITDSYGGSSDTQDNCCLRGTTNIEAYDAYLGTTNNSIGICGFALIKSMRSTLCDIDTMMGSVYLEAAGSITGIIASGYFKGDYHAKCTNYNMSSDGIYSFTTYDAASSGGAGIIDIEATSVIDLNGVQSSLFGVDVFLKAPVIRRNNPNGDPIYLYGNNGQGRACIECGEGQVAIKPYYYDTVSIKASRWYGNIIANKSGPWSAKASVYNMRWYLDIVDMQGSLYTYTDGDNIRVNVVGRIGQWSGVNPLVWDDNIDLDTLPALDGTAYYFSVTVGSHSQNTDAKPCLIPDNSGLITFLDDVLAASNTTPVSAITPVLDDTLAVATLVARSYNVISIPSEAVDLRIEVPVETEPAVLTEMAFEFALSDVPLRSIEFKSVGVDEVTFAKIIPTLEAGKLYQGTIVNRCITIVSFTL
jgi:hypothetical protein